MHENGIMMKKVKTIEPVSEIIFSMYTRPDLLCLRKKLLIQI